MEIAIDLFKNWDEFLHIMTARKMEFKEKLKEMLIRREQQLYEFFNKNKPEPGSEELDEFRTGATSEENGLNEFETLLHENQDQSIGDESDSNFSDGSGAADGGRDWERGGSEEGTSEISTPSVRPEEVEGENEEDQSDGSSSESHDTDEDGKKEGEEEGGNPENPENAGGDAGANPPNPAN